ncbi:hypothetical protein [Microlunatus antarcticus]|uniref:Uncharacterized protein n=1 Tax=Microlunatus antarcticus TaxID=53388 RepID=A0A7W5JUF1_9ACTN|nr:hypothetical protein [Microlunatus antarcticus]MBB3326544.1 hypothetical protein [Microlunatus antarcticus]
MPDDWSWFFSSEYGRDRMLREEVEGLQASASASSAQSARLSSQLRTLQGSIESRLQALSTAFDAYVELGDVREQLAAHPDTSAVRRDVLRALTVLEQRGVPEPVDGRDVDYWLVDAANEVLRLASTSGVADVAPTPGTSQEHETFVVAALGWLGHGDRVAARVAPLLVGDGALAAPQVLLWRAATHGLYGDVLGTVRESWGTDLDLGGSTWDAFAQRAAGSAEPVAVLRRFQEVLDGTWTPDVAPTATADAVPSKDAPPTDDRAALRRLLDALVGAGLGDERALLERARVLRARIEDPGAVEADPQAEPPRTSTTDLVQQALLDPGTTSDARRRLAAWARPGLEAAAQEIGVRVAAEQPGPVVASTPLGQVEVGTDGADPARLAQLDVLADQRWATPRSRVLVPGVLAGVALVVGLVLLAMELGALGVFLLVVAVVAGGLTLRELFRARTRRRELADARQRVQQKVAEAREVAVAARQAAQEKKAQVAGLARAVVESGTPAGPDLR